MFEGFQSDTLQVDGNQAFVRYGGDGPPVLLLHGHPRTSATWHRVAPQLVAHGLTVVCADLRGYGRSRGPEPTADHSGYSKRATAGDLMQVMKSLGHERFGVAGHDRGGLVAMRMALDHPEAVSRVALLDCIPLSEHMSRITRKFAETYWHWFFFGLQEIPERVINADPDDWYEGDPQELGQENYDEWRAATRKPEVVRAMLEDYRAGLTIDLVHEAADWAAGTRIECPALTLWSRRDDPKDIYLNPVKIWESWVVDVHGHAIDSDHHMAEEAPDAVASSLGEFFKAQ